MSEMVELSDAALHEIREIFGAIQICVLGIGALDGSTTAIYVSVMAAFLLYAIKNKIRPGQTTIRVTPFWR